jgi:5S rRNA maturation endonuclease (ribonuclease M5)
MLFTDLLKELKIDFKSAGEHHHVTTGWIGLECPFCGSGSYHLGYNLRYGYLSCWRCGPHNVAKTVALLGQVDYGIVKKRLEGLATQRIERGYEPKGEYLPPPAAGPMLTMHKRYLKEKRGLNPEEIERIWRVGGIGFCARLPFRLFIPIFHHGEKVSWTTRTIQEKGRRYVSASREEEKISHKRLLYGADYARHSVIVCEGPLDVWAIGPGAVSTFGCAFTRAQLVRLAKYPSRGILFDRDADGERQAERLANDLAPFAGDTFLIRLETGKDAASAERAEIEELRRRFLTEKGCLT